ncbi:MAG: extracellular solute-binding protein [Magnetovibrionaceae bacterium]
MRLPSRLSPSRLAAFALVAASFVLAAPASAEEVKPVQGIAMNGIAMHGIAMHGAPKYGPDFTHFDYVNPNAPKGGVVKLAANGSFDTFNPFNAKGEAANGIGLIYNTLLTSAADEAFTQYGEIAETMEVPEDRSWIIFNLRSEARWHDGKPMTAEDVVWTFNTFKIKGSPQLQFYYKDVSSAEALGPHRVKFSFSESVNRELPLIIGQMTILPKHYWQDREFSETTLEPPVGSGPYRIKAFETGRWIEFERVKDYWGASVPANQGFYNFDLIRYDFYRDTSVLVEAFLAGQYDYRAENSSKNWATSYNVPELESGQLVKEELSHNRSSGMQAWGMNMRRDLFKDKRVRQALAYAFDYEWSNKNLFYGQYSRTRSFYDNSELAATGLPQGEELAILEKFRDQLPAEVFTEEYNPPSTDGTGRIRANLREADKLLRDAGWTIKDGKRVNAQGKAFEFEILLVSPLFERIALPFAKNLERLGITAGVRTVDTSQYIERVRSFDFDMMVAGWGQSLSPGNEQRGFWTTEAADRPSSQNIGGIKNPVIDELVELVISAPDRESLIQRTRALDRVLQWGHYVIPHWHSKYDRVVYWNMFGHPEKTPTSGNQFFAWWVDPDKAAALDRRRSTPN